MAGKRQHLQTWVLPGGLLLIFGALLQQVLIGGPVVALDRLTRRWVLAHHPAELVSVSTWITDLGSPALSVIALGVVSLMISRSRRTRRPLWLAACSAGVLGVTVLSLKAIVNRPGPGLHEAGQLATGYFPSGHAASALTCYGVIAVLAAGESRPRRRLGYLAAGVAAFVVGICMVYSNFHWLSDVLAAWALGGALIAIMQERLRRGGKPQPFFHDHQGEGP